MIEIHHLKFQYQSRWIFKNAGTPNEITLPWLITGDNGSGKSTLLRILAGLLTPQDGTIMYRGIPLKEYIQQYGLSAMFHELFLTPSLTVRKHIQLHADFFEQNMDPTDYARKFNLNTQIDTTVAELSRGQKQKLAFALTLIPPHRLLILDEPFANMDSSSIQCCIHALKDYGKSFIATSHQTLPFKDLHPITCKIFNGIFIWP